MRLSAYTLMQLVLTQVKFHTFCFYLFLPIRSVLFVSYRELVPSNAFCYNTDTIPLHLGRLY